MVTKAIAFSGKNILLSLEKVEKCIDYVLLKKLLPSIFSEWEDVTKIIFYDKSFSFVTKSKKLLFLIKNRKQKF